MLCRNPFFATIVLVFLVLADGVPAIETRVSPATGVVRFVTSGDGSPIVVPLPPGRQQAEALDFFLAHGHLFGITDPDTQLVFEDATTDHLDRTRSTFKQVHEGVAVFGAVLRVHTNARGEFLVANGTFVPGLKLNTTPTLTAEDAIVVAVAEVAGQKGGQVGLRGIATTLYVYRVNLVRGIPGPNRLVYEVEVGNGRDVREFVYVDAQTGVIVDQITGIYDALDRDVYDGGYDAATLVWSEGDPPYTGGNIDVEHVIDYAEDMYNVLASATNGTYLSYDGVGATMESVANSPFIGCPNASWNGVFTQYCPGVTPDDVVAHEWGHAYTRKTHGLIYAWQSGALNESYSDIFGETIDLLNGAGTDIPDALRTDGSCSIYDTGGSDDSYRWLQGEDATAFGGAIRDLWNPNCHGDPGRVGDTDYYWCGTLDGGGVHTNSGVPNHGYALLVDGGTYNGQTILGIGITKAFHIYWRAASVYQVPTTDFADHADALEQSCDDLVGVNLFALSAASPAGTPSGEIISTADCAELAKAVLAVELRTEPTFCGFTPMLAPDALALCAGGGVPEMLLLQDWESGLGGWTVGTRALANPATFDTLDWAVVGGLPDGRAGSAAFVADSPELGDCAADTEAGVLYLQSPVISIPAGTAGLRLAFDHWVATELAWDGANVKISVNGGPYALVPATAFTFNRYNVTLFSSDDPLGGEDAFSGTNGGEVTGSWGPSRVDLAGLAAPGDDVELRFELGLDGCNGIVGWYIDEVRVFTCEPVDCNDCAPTCDDCNDNGVPDACEMPGVGTLFDPQVVYGAGDRPASAAVGDLDGDGNLDLVVANLGSDNVSVRFNGGNGAFGAGVAYGVGTAPVSVAVGDLDGDGDLDLVAANSTGNNISVLLNNGNGIFAAQVAYSVGELPFFVAVGDVDGDGDLDLVAANLGGEDISVLFNNGDGTFAAQVAYGVGEGPFSVAVADLDGDASLDLAVVTSGSDTVSVLFNNGDGTFASQVPYRVGVYPASVAAGHLNGDGDLDLVVTNTGGHNVSVLLNNGDGTFAAGMTYGAGLSPMGVAVGHLNGDADLDLVIASLDGDHVVILFNNGDGTFAPGVTYGAGLSPASVAVGDLDGDGDLDLVVANLDSDDVSVLLHVGGDCDASGTLDECDLFAGTSADCDANGVPDVCEVAVAVDPATGLSSSDADNNGLLDVCDANAPLPAASPHDVDKNRYVSFSPNNADNSVAISVLLPDGRTGWVDGPQLVDWGGVDSASVSLVVDSPVFRMWTEETVHVAGCVVAPDETYEFRATTNGANFTSPLFVQTVPAPSAGSWADTVGGFDSGSQTWSAPNGVVNFQDIGAAVKKFQVDPTAPHVTVVDLHPQWPNYIMNFSDIDMVIKGFQSVAYPVPAGDCQTIANCPLGGVAACLP